MFIDTFPKRMHFPTGTWKIVKVAVLCCIVYCLHISFHGSFVHIFCLGLIFSHQQGLRCSLLVRHPGLCVSVLLCQVYSYDLCQRVMSFIHSTTPQYKIYCSTFNPTSYFLATFSILSFFLKVNHFSMANRNVCRLFFYIRCLMQPSSTISSGEIFKYQNSQVVYFPVLS